MSDDLRSWLEPRLDRIENKVDGQGEKVAKNETRVALLERRADDVEADVANLSKRDSDGLAKTGGLGVGGGVAGGGLVELVRYLWEHLGGRS